MFEYNKESSYNSNSRHRNCIKSLFYARFISLFEISTIFFESTTLTITYERRLVGINIVTKINHRSHLKICLKLKRIISCTILTKFNKYMSFFKNLDLISAVYPMRIAGSSDEAFAALIGREISFRFSSFPVRCIRKW